MYMKINDILIDYNDITNIEHVAYEAIPGTNQPDMNKPVYRVFLDNGSFLEAALTNEVIERYNTFKKEQNT